MEKEIKKALNKIFSIFQNRLRFVLIMVILFLVVAFFMQYIKAIIIAIIFIILAGLSKFYHRFFKSSLGIDLVFFTTLMICLAYNNMFLSFLVGWLGLIIADTIGSRFSYTSVISLSALSIVILVSRFFSGIDIMLSAIILTIIYDSAAVFLYTLMGSTYNRIIVFLASHFFFNLFLIVNFSRMLMQIMI